MKRTSLASISSFIGARLLRPFALSRLIASSPNLRGYV
ncbi:MAG: hypothetical protein ACJA1I_002467 [Zhongshania marina]